MIYPDLYALLYSDPDARRKIPPANARGNMENSPAAGLENFRQSRTEASFPLGVYPVFDDDVPRDNSFDNFSAPDLRNLHPYPGKLGRQYSEERHETSRVDMRSAEE